MGSLNLFHVLAVGAGGFAGAVLRYLITFYTQSGWDMESLPAGTIIANLLGCLVIGLLAGLFHQKEWLSPEMNLFIFTGLIGGFTTFSTFANESVLLWRSGALGLAVSNVLIQIVFGLILVWIGYISSSTMIDQ